MVIIRIFKGDIGTKIRLNAFLVLPDDSDSIIRIKYRKPDGTTGYWEALVEDSQYASYIIEPGDLDVAGSWGLQLYVETAGWKGSGEIVEMVVYEPIEIEEI